MDDRPLRLRVRTDAAQRLGGVLLSAGVVVGVRIEAARISVLRSG